MVRLDGNDKALNSLPFDQFQFQYGAIRCLGVTVGITSIFDVSIPIWCD